MINLLFVSFSLHYEHTHQFIYSLNSVLELLHFKFEPHGRKSYQDQLDALLYKYYAYLYRISTLKRPHIFLIRIFSRSASLTSTSS